MLADDYQIISAFLRPQTVVSLKKSLYGAFMRHKLKHKLKDVVTFVYLESKISLYNSV